MTHGIGPSMASTSLVIVALGGARPKEPQGASR